MSINATHWAMQVCRSRDDLSQAERLVLIFMADHHNISSGRIDPGQETLAKECGITPRSVRNQVSSLEEKGLLSVIREKDSRGFFLGNKYVLNIPKNDGNLVPETGPENISPAPEIGGETISSKPVKPEVEKGLSNDNPKNGDCDLFSDGQSAPLPDKPETNTVEMVPRLDPEKGIGMAFRIYNCMARRTGIPVCQSKSPERRRKMAARLADVGGIEGWQTACEKVEASPHCTGSNDRGWTATIDFMLQPGGLTKIMEGNYDARKPVGGTRRFDAGDTLGNIGNLLDG